MDVPTDTWQVDIDGALYDADTETLTQWVLDGYVARTTKVKKGSLQWIEIGRVPAFRGMFSSGEAAAPGAFAEPAAPPAFAEPAAFESSASAAAVAPAYGAPAPGPAVAPQPAYAPANVCANHPAAPAKYMCQGCGAALCIPCVKRYGNAALCTLCGELCKPYGEAQATIKRAVDRYSGFGLADLAAGFAYPLKDPVAFVLAAIFYGFLNLVGTYGRFAAAGVLFAYMSYAIRRVAMGHYDEGPSPDLSDPGEWLFESAKCGLAVTIVTFGPLIALFLYGVGGGVEGLGDLATVGAGMLLALAWAVLYYPMAMLVAGYTADFVSIVNPLVGLSTMKLMGAVYWKAYAMCAAMFVVQWVLVSTLGAFDEQIELKLPPLVGGVLFLLLSIAKGAIWFYASMVMAAVLGLAVFKKADELGVYVR